MKKNVKEIDKLSNKEAYIGKIDRLYFLIQSDDIESLKKIDTKDSSFLHIFPDQSTFLNKAIEWNSPNALSYLLENINWSDNVYEFSDRLYYACVNKETGMLNRKLASILIKHIIPDVAWKIDRLFEVLSHTDIESIGFMINEGVSIFKDEKLNREKGYTSDYSLIKTVVTSNVDNIKICKYLSENNYCKWDDELLDDPILYHVILNAHIDEIYSYSEEAVLFKEKMLFFIEEGCSLESKINFEIHQGKSIKEYFLEIIDMDVEGDDKVRFNEMFTEINAFYEKKKINLSIENEKPSSVKVKRL